MSPKDQARILLLQKAVLDELQAINAADRAKLADSMDVGERLVGKLQLDDDEIVLGNVQLTNGAKAGIKVADMDALLDWANHNQPDEVVSETTWAIRPATVKSWLARLAAGKPITSEVTGEDFDWLPGVERTQPGRPIFKVNVDHETVKEIALSILATSGLREIEA